MSKIHFYQGQNEAIQNKDSIKTDDDLIDEIKKKIAEFFNMKNIHFLFGSGTSANAIPIMSGLFDDVKDEIELSDADQVKLFARVESDSNENLEEILGVLYSRRIYLNGIISSSNKVEKYIEITNALIETIEGAIFDKINVKFAGGKPQRILDYYKEFYQKVALRNKDLSRINIFITNNDLFNETALDSLNINYINGFGGGLNRYFNPALFNYTFSKRMDTSIEKFEPVENMVYLYKLHGSINWIEEDIKSNTFFNIKEIYKPVKSKSNNVMIYPNPTKQDKSLGSPYVDLFREFQKKLLEPNSVLFVIGYSFSDEHVNNIIYQALATNSSINIVIINRLKDKRITEIDDSRIFRIYEEKDEDDLELIKYPKTRGTEEIHHFSYIVKHLIPDVNTFKGNDNALEKFLKEFNEKLRP